MRLHAIVVCISVLTLSAASASAEVPTYTIQDLGGDVCSSSGPCSLMLTVTGINEKSQVIGYTWSNGQHLAFRTAPNSPIDLPRDYIGTLGGNSSLALGINAYGPLAGSSQAPSGASRGFRTAPDADINPLTDDIGTLSGSGTSANAYCIASDCIPRGLNNSSQIVGGSSRLLGIPLQYHACLYMAGTLYDLNTQIPSGTGWILTNAIAINDNGQILGTGTLDGLNHVFRLDPVPTMRPMIVPHISGALGEHGWYQSDVTISWTVTNAHSTNGCHTRTLTTDTAGTTLTCSAMNGTRQTNSVSVTIKIDKTAPVISGMPVAGCFLWPPNHHFVQVADVKASDSLSGVAPGSLHVTGKSYKPSDPKDPDIVITPDGSGGYVVQLRADRLGTGTGRAYTLNATATDFAGNMATVTATCTAPHDLGHHR